MRDDLYYQYNPWWEGDFSFETIPRPEIEAKLIHLISDKSVVFLSGLRRVGKTTLMKILILHLLQQGLNPKHLFYVSLDDYLLKDLTIIDIITEFRKLQHLTFDTKIYAFLDEIIYKKEFRHQLKNIYDHQNVKIFASSSSSSAFRDKKGFLTGRERFIEINPLSFDEFLQFKNIELKKRDSVLKETYFEDYLNIGGMPEYVLHQDREYLTALVEDILYKDIVAYHGLKHPHLIMDYFALLMERAGKQISLNKIANILSISPDTAKRYLHMFEETFLIHLVPRYGKTNETILSQKKIYAADLGIRNLITGFRDKDALFENVIFKMIKPFKPRYIYQNSIEIDFITENKILIEVKYKNNLNNKQLALFDEIKAQQKIVIKNVYDLEKLKALLKNHCHSREGGNL